MQGWKTREKRPLLRKLSTAAVHDATRRHSGKIEVCIPHVCSVFDNAVKLNFKVISILFRSLAMSISGLVVLGL